MRLLHTHKKTLQIILLLISLVVIPFATTLLLDWSFIQGQIVRAILVYLLIIVEIAVVLLLLKDVVVNNENLKK